MEANLLRNSDLCSRNGYFCRTTPNENSRTGAAARSTPSCSQSGACRMLRRAAHAPSYSSKAQLQKGHPLPHWQALCLYTFSSFTLTFHAPAVTPTVLEFSIMHPLDSVHSSFCSLLKPCYPTLNSVCQNTHSFISHSPAFRICSLHPHIFSSYPKRKPIYSRHSSVQIYYICQNKGVA